MIKCFLLIIMIRGNSGYSLISLVSFVIVKKKLIWCVQYSDLCKIHIVKY